jgi:hypothetical protein
MIVRRGSRRGTVAYDDATRASDSESLRCFNVVETQQLDVGGDSYVASAYG